MRGLSVRKNEFRVISEIIDTAAPVSTSIFKCFTFTIRPHKQTSLFHILARTQYLELIWSLGANLVTCTR